jgi:hypothetical protein
VTEFDNYARQPAAGDAVDQGEGSITQGEINVPRKISQREVVRLLTEHLSTDEIRSLYLAAKLDNDYPMGMRVYQAAQALFTQNNGRQMHAEAIQELGAILAERMGSRAE